MVATVITKLLSLKLRTVLIAAMTASAIDALPAVAGPERLAHVLASEVTRPPAGWVEFCARQPGECASTTTAPRDLTLSPEGWKDLVRINKSVNETIKPLTDLEHWGVVERWSYPDDGYGDCEDYVLLKRRMLIQSGWPREALLVTVVRDQKQEGSRRADGDHRQGRLRPRQSDPGHSALVGDWLPFRQAPIAVQSQRLGLAGRFAAGDRYGDLTLNASSFAH
jgi:predicted transglutaminase-like cysteine proteinase